MTFISSQQAYTQATGTASTNQPVIETRNPNSRDVSYPIGKFWINKSSGTLWFLGSQSSPLGNLTSSWTEVTGGTLEVETLTGDSGGTVSPTANNINIKALYTNTVVGNPGTSTLTITPTASGYPITPFVVGPVGKAGYQTIQSALTAAGATGSAQMVYVQPGTYTENLTFPDVNISLWGDRAGNTIISGVHTPSIVGTLELHGLLLSSATDILNSAAAGNVSIEISDSFILVTNGFVYNLPNWTGTLLFDDCGEASTNDGVVNNTAGATIKFINTEMGAGSGKTMTLTGNGNVRFDTCNVNCPVNIAGSGTIIFQNGCKFANTVTVGGSKTGNITETAFLTGSNQAFVMSSSGNINMDVIVIDSTNNPAIGGAGAGTLNLANVTYVNNSSVAGTVTAVNPGLTDLGSIRSNFTAHSLLLGQGTRGTLTALGAATNGQIPIGSTGADPVLATLTAGTGISISNGAGTITITNSDASTSFNQVVVQTFTSNGTYTPTSGMQYCIIEVQGGGGGGGAANATGATTVSIGGGGGCGGYSRGVFSAASIGASKTVTIGAGGSGGAVDNADGSSGSTSSVGVLITATGGSGGAHGAAGVASSAVGAGAGAAGSGGSFNVVPGTGYAGFALNTGTHYVATAGNGGSSVFGSGGRGLNAADSSGAVNGESGNGYGSGGGGGLSTISSGTGHGGAGASGIVIVTEFISA